MSKENRDMNLDTVKTAYMHSAGFRNIALLLVMLVGWGIAIGLMKSDLAVAQSTATEAKANSLVNHEALTEIKSDVKLIKDDQEELEQDVKQLKADTMKQTILLERIATKMRVSTETN